MLKDDFMLYRKSFSIDGLNLKFYIIKCTQLKTLLSCKQFIAGIGQFLLVCPKLSFYLLMKDCIAKKLVAFFIQYLFTVGL